MLRKPLVWIPLALLLLFGALLLGGYALVPGLVRSQGTAWVDKNLPGKQLTMGEIDFSPLQLKLDIKDIAIADARAPQAPLVAIKALSVDAGIASLWTLSPRLDAVTVDTPAIDAVLRKDGSLNLVELVPPDDGKPVPEVWIGDLSVANGRVDFTDRRAATAHTRRLTPVTFDLKDFATTATRGGGFRFDAASDEGEKFAWAGTLSMAPLASAGSFNIGALKLASIGRLAGDMIPARLTAGAVDIAGRYNFATPPKGSTVFDADVTTLIVRDADITATGGDRLAVRTLRVAPTKLSLAGDALTIGDVAIDGITVTRPTGERAAINAATLGATRYGIASGTADIGAAAVRGISVTGKGKGAETVALAGVGVAPSQVATTTRTARIGLVTADGLRVGMRLAPDNSISIPGLYPMPASPAAPAAEGPAWKTTLAGLALTDAAVRIAARGQTINLAPMTVKLGAVTSDLDTPLAIDAATGINGKARFAMKGTAAPDGTTADLAIDLAGLPLADFAALAPPSAVVTRAGTLGARGRVLLTRAGPAYNGNLAVSNLDLGQRSNNGDLIGWKQLDVTGIRYQAAPQRLAIDRVAFDRAVSHLVISPDARINVQTVAGIEPVTDPETPAAGPEKAPETPVARPVKASAKPIKPRVVVSAPVSNTLNSAGKMFPITIREVSVRDSTIAFADYSIQPNFAAKIQGFNGKVTGLSTAPGSQAAFDLKGFIIDRFSPVTITGSANPFAYDANTDLTAKFSNIELPVFNPYSGRFAGYAIAKGKLSTTLHYQIVNRGLKADHNIVLDQLTWGEATDSKDKVSLPIRLATSLLKDKNGVIDLDLPVEGTLDDPKFKVWPVIWQVVGNVFTKIITAPFALIGSLFGGGDQAQFIVFAAGSAELPADAGKTLAALAKGLAERPEVNLDIPAGPGIREDAEALTTQKLETAILGGKTGPFDTGKRVDRMKSLYKDKFGKGAKFPEGMEKAGVFAGGEAKDAAATAQAKWLEEQLRPKFAPTDADLAALGQARADAVKLALLAEGSIAPTRVFVSTETTVKPKSDKVEMELAVK